MRRAHRAANGGSGLSTEAAESASDDFFDDSPRELRFKSSSTWDFQVSDNGVIKVGESGFKVFEGPKERSEFSEGQVARDRLVLDSTRVIGRGASSLVYFGTDGPTGRKCAVKVVNILDPQRRHQVGREIATFAKCMEWHCDTLVELLGVHRGAEGKVHIVLEYMDLGSLEDLMRPLSLGDVHDGRPLRPLTEAGANCGHPAIPERVLAAMGYQVLLGLKHLHMLHNLHRDIKPSNILINSRGEVKLTDLGVAWQLDHLDATVDSVVGSVRYMSPERLGGQPYGWQADVWSFGIVLLECASLQNPWGGRSQVEMLQLINEQGSRDLVRRGGQHMSSAFQAMVAASLQVKPPLRSGAEELLGSRWFANHSIASRGDAVAVVCDYVKSSAIPPLLT